MSELSCLFGRATADVLHALQADPTCCDRLHRFEECEGVDVPTEGLAVVHLSGAVMPPWLLDEMSTGVDAADLRMERAEQVVKSWTHADVRRLGLMVPPLARHEWLADALPPAHVIAHWAEISRVSGQRLAWWWWWERGDDLYADASWLFAPDDQSMIVRETYLVAAGAEDKAVLYTRHGGVRSLPPDDVPDSPFGLAMKHLGLRATHQYFPPAESWHFDWAPFRYR